MMALMLQCMAFYDCNYFFFSGRFFPHTSDLGETANQEGLGNQIYLTGKELKSPAADYPLVQGFEKGKGGKTLMYL